MPSLSLITENVMHYCPGCSHGTIHKLVAEVIDEMGMEGKTIAVSPVRLFGFRV